MLLQKLTIATFLCDFKDKNEQDIVNYIIKRLYDLIGDNEKEFRKYMSMLEELSSNRDLEENVKKGEKMLTELEIAKNLLDILDSEIIVVKTGLTIEDVEKLKIDMSKK